MASCFNWEKTLHTLQFKTASDFEDNLNRLTTLIAQCESGSIILAPEVSLTSFCYDKMADAASFANRAKEDLKKLSSDRTVVLTMIVSEDGGYKNRLFVFHRGEIVYSQPKVKLFELGDEHKKFIAGNEGEINFFYIDGIKCASLICFELRFVEFWQKIRGADLVFVPAMWGKPRKSHFEGLSFALAVANQCYVLASDSANDDMACGSAIITPFGEFARDDTREILKLNATKKEILTMRKYLNTGVV